MAQAVAQALATEGFEPVRWWQIFEGGDYPADRLVEVANAVSGAVFIARATASMWGSDYPHPDGIWPDSQKWIAEDLGSVSPAVQRKIVCENAGKLYGLL